MAWLVVFGLFLVPHILQLVEAQRVKSTFSCEGRISGYYADVGSGCQNYHMCDGLGRQFSYACPNATLFQQRMLICDHWYMVNCSKSESEYSANSLIGQKGKLFVDDSDVHPYHRTPRPDLLSHPSALEYNIIYRTNRDQANDLNLVGAESDETDDNSLSTKEPRYFLPSHWSTEYPNRSTTELPTGGNKFNAVTSDVKKQTKPKLTTPVPVTRITQVPRKDKVTESISFSASNNYRTSQKPFTSRSNQGTAATIKVNFKSDFVATTPVYPTVVDEALKNDNADISPPFSPNVPNVNTNNENLEPVKVNFESHFKATTPVYPKFVDENLKQNNLELFPPFAPRVPEKPKVVNFVSNFVATTPVYPQQVANTSPLPEKVGLLPPLPYMVQNQDLAVDSTTKISINFESNFPATVPVYPTSVEATSPIPDDVGLLPPLQKSTSVNGKFLNFNFGPPSNGNNGQNIDVSSEELAPSMPSQFYQPPKFLPDFLNEEEVNDQPTRRNVVNKNINQNQWGDLRRMFFIPDYDFPLDSASRPSYDSELSSFQVRSSSINKR